MQYKYNRVYLGQTSTRIKKLEFKNIERSIRPNKFNQIKTRRTLAEHVEISSHQFNFISTTVIANVTVTKMNTPIRI